METGWVITRLVYPGRGMVNMSVYTHAQHQKW